MQFGVCVGIDQGAQAKSFGWDFVELNVQSVFQGTVPDDQWKQPAPTAVPTPAANSLVPGAMKIVGPSVDADALADYLLRVTARAAQIGCSTLVFGSGVARHLPDGWDRGLARQQILDFLKAAAAAAEEQNLTIVVEPLNKGECNILNTVAECVSIVRELAHPNVKQLVDTYHLWLDGDSLDAVRDAERLIHHVHVADKDGRVAPGESGNSDYRSAFAALKDIGYDRRISVECLGWDWAKHGERCLAFLKREWDAA